VERRLAAKLTGRLMQAGRPDEILGSKNGLAIKFIKNRRFVMNENNKKGRVKYNVILECQNTTFGSFPS